MKNSIKSKINESKTIVILPHEKPDGDAIGSSIAFHHVLKQKNKDVYIISNDPAPLSTRFLEFESYTTEEFDKLNINHDLVITLDSGDEDRFDTRKKYLDNKYVINIDHHITNTNYGDINYVKEASSVGEILFDIFTELNCEIDTITAEALYVSISTDTGSFKYSNTSANTLLIASKLRDKVDLEKINTELYQNISYESLVLKNKVLETLKIYNNMFGIIFLTKKMIVEMDLEFFETGGLVEEVRNINGVEVSAFIKEKDDNKFKISFRSKYDFDVAKIALKYNGGGHKKAAGASIEGTLEEVINELVEVIK